MTTPPPTPADQSGPIPVPKVIKRWLPFLKAVVPALVTLIIAVADARTGKHEVSEKTDTAYETLAPPTNANSARIAKIEDSIRKLADTVELQGKLLLAMQPGFTTAGVPAPAPAKPPTPAQARKKAKRLSPPADPALVKKVQVQAVKTLAEIKQRAADPAPTAPPLPPTIPAQPPALPAPASEPPKN